MERTVVLFPGLGVGHLVPMVELAKVFLQHGLAATVALVKPPLDSPEFSATVARFMASNPSINFHVLPPPPPVSEGSGSDATNAPLRDFLRSLPTVDALIIDMFCGDALDIAAELGLPAYSFFPSSASDLAVSLNLPSMRDSINTSFGELRGTIISFPGIVPFKASELPSEILNNNEASELILHMFVRMSESRGIRVNTFESLETGALRALSDRLCIPGRATPPVYCIGPLVSGGGGGDKEHECLRWLDAQPDHSVVFLSFGSMGTFLKKQLEEIAIGLRKSEQRFLWVVRSPRIHEQIWLSRWRSQTSTRSFRPVSWRRPRGEGSW
ncbi:hypothetical protein E2562_028282 [Oryza meyeriana var. granulata]|uniref:UDP-glycosyltransferases domain-containing protein n=1 Tax=Oryza meyeriana var. granulata TaxID=110450 RepID=A0A6G1E3J5_9ORYZ|nr:hypothetical protein E2562_028282 [Oryza meyeriana var. granulata]